MPEDSTAGDRRTYVTFPGLDVTAGVVLTCDRCDEEMVTDGQSADPLGKRVEFECPECGHTRTIQDIQSGDVV